MWLVALLGVLSACAGPGWAKDATGVVSYSPTSQNVEGNIPYQQSYVVYITAPQALVGSATVTVQSTVTSAAPGYESKAAGYLAVTPATLTFSAGQTRAVTVTFSINETVPPESSPLLFSYRINTVGWPAGVSDANGHSINARATVPPPGAGDLPPTVVISTPVKESVYSYSAGGLPATIPLDFTATATITAPLLTVDASLTDPAGKASSIQLTTSGLNTATAQGIGNLVLTLPGRYTIVARGTNRIGTAKDVTSFTVQVSGPPPIPEIVTPAPNSEYTYVEGSSPLSIPFTFNGRSPLGPLRTLSASLNGVTVYSVAGLSTPQASGTVNLSVSTGGTHVLAVTATNDYGTATTTSTFTVRLVSSRPPVAEGIVFFDANFDGVRNVATEPGIGGFSVRLLNSANQVVGSSVSANDGSYQFVLDPGSYTVVVGGIPGLSATTLNEHALSVGTSNIRVPDTGFGLHFASLRGMTANGYSHGFWKNNVSKAVAGRSGGTQVSADAIRSYTQMIGSLWLAPYQGISMQGALDVLSNNSSKATDLLSKQLIASEYNLAHGGYINGSPTLTSLFVLWGEIVLNNPGSYSESYTLFAKDWFDAYNNSHGGLVRGPQP